MKLLIVLWMCILVACVPVPEAKVEPTSTPPIVAPTLAIAREQSSAEPATRTVKQEGSLGTVVYGLTEDNRVVRIEKTDAVWEYLYENGRLTEIRGPENVEFMYQRGKLASVDSGPLKLEFRYDSRGRLVEVKGFKETLHMEYDSLDLLRGVKRGVAGETGIDYDKQGKIKYLTRGLVTTNVYFDDKGRVRNFDADDVKFILGYWRDGKIISLTGKTFGAGLTASYGPGYPPFEADIISSEDASKFTSPYTDTLYKVVDTYLYCKHVRRLKDVLFDGISYTFYVNYFKGDLPGYLAMQFACVPYEA